MSCAGKKRVATGAHPVARGGFQFVQSGQDLQPLAKRISNRLGSTLCDVRRACKKCMSTLEDEQCCPVKAMSSRVWHSPRSPLHSGDQTKGRHSITCVNMHVLCVSIRIRVFVEDCCSLCVCVCVSTIDGKGSSPSKTSLSPNAVKIVCANAVKQLIALIMMRCPWWRQINYCKQKTDLSDFGRHGYKWVCVCECQKDASLSNGFSETMNY